MIPQQSSVGLRVGSLNKKRRLSAINALKEVSALNNNNNINNNANDNNNNRATTSFVKRCHEIEMVVEKKQKSLKFWMMF